VKISKIYISAFGGLKDYTLELSDGFNCIFGENENGKSTVSAFIKMMFYGSGRTVKQISKNPRLKYTPWSGDAMGGRIYFEHSGYNYCLEREFKKSDSTDKITLRNLDLGSSETVESNVGKRFFGLEEAAFERSIFISQAGIFDTNDDANGEIATRLSNIASTGDETTSYQQIVNRINDAQLKLKTPRHVGDCDKAIAELEQLQTELSKAESSAILRQELTEKIKQLKIKLSETKKAYDSVKKTVDNENDLRLSQKMREYLATKQELDELTKGITLSDSSTADELFLSKVRFCLSKLSAEKTRTEEKSNEVSTLERSIEISENKSGNATPERLDELKQKIDTLQKQREDICGRLSETDNEIKAAEEILENAKNAKKAFNPLLLAVGLVAVISGAVLFFVLSAIPAVIAAVLGALFIVLAFIIRPADSAKRVKAELELSELRSKQASFETKQASILAAIASETTEIQMISAALHTDKALLEQKKSELADKKETLAQQKQKLQAAQNDLFNLIERFCDSHDITEIEAAVEELAQKSETVKNIKLRLKYLSRDLNNISYEEAEEKLKQTENKDNVSDADFEAAKQKLDELNQLGINLSGELSAAATELKAQLEKAVDPETLSKRITELKQKIAEQEKFYNAAQLAKQVLEESFGEVRRGYGSVLEDKTLEIFSGITSGRYRNINISKSMELEAESSSTFGTHSIEYLSQGTVDQAYLSLRLAVASLISNETPLPIFLDDVLAQYDDKRCKMALTFLKEFSSNSQVTLFTCHNSTYETAKILGAECKNLK